MAYTASTLTRTKRTEQFTSKARMEIRTLGTEDWYTPPAYEGWNSQSSNNLLRANFTPGRISVLQEAVKPRYGNDGRLQSALFMWQATFNTSDLHNIRIRESEFGHSSVDGQFRIRIEVMAICKAPPTGQGLFVREGTFRDLVFNNAKDSSNSNASSSGLAKISERWVSGEQEIKLSFTRKTQTERTPGKNRPKGQKEPVTGPKVWVWHAFLAFMSGATWTSDTLTHFTNAAHLKLADIVNKDHPNPHVDFEKEEDWVLIKMKIDDGEQQRRAGRAARFGPMGAADPSTANLSVLPARPSASVLGKRPMTESVEMAGRRKKVEIETLESLKEEVTKSRLRAEILREEERAFRVKAEEEEERTRRLQLRLEELD